MSFIALGLPCLLNASRTVRISLKQSLPVPLTSVCLSSALAASEKVTALQAASNKMIALLFIASHFEEQVQFRLPTAIQTKSDCHFQENFLHLWCRHALLQTIYLWPIPIRRPILTCPILIA